MRRKGWLALACCAPFSLPLHAQPDALASPQCRAARAGLEAAREEAAVSSRPRPDPRLLHAQQQVRDVCLGPSPGQRARSGAPEPPLTVAPPVIDPAHPSAMPPMQAVPPPVVITRPTVITTCDPSGCWDSEGRRLNNAGAVLMGPRGLCSGAGNVVNCP